MRKLILVAHTSLDGFVAGKNGELDGFDSSEENLEFVCKITEEADAALFGRISWELLDAYWPTARDREGASRGDIAYSNWYNSAHKIVLSRTMANAAISNTTVISDNLLEEITRIKKQPGKNILIFGSPAAFQSLLPLDLVDEYWIFVNPVIFGEGIPLFRENKSGLKLRLNQTKQFQNGEMAMNYTRIR